MPRNGNGDYDLPAGNPVVPGTVIESEWANNTMNDLAAALTDSLSADGQTTPINNLPMGGFHHTGVSDPTLRNQYATLGMTQDGKNSRIQSLAGVDNLTGTLVGQTTAYASGAIYSFFAPAANTGPMTLSFNGIASKSIVTSQGIPLMAADLIAGQNYLIQYTGTVFQLLTPVASQAGSTYTQSAVTGWRRPENGVYPPITLGSGTTVNIPAGTGVIVPPGADGANDAYAVSWNAQSVTLSYLTSSFSTAIAIDGTGIAAQFAGRIPTADERNYILLGMAIHVNGTASSVVTTPAIYGDNGYLNIDTANILSNVLISGGETTPNGANLLLNVAGGLISQPGGNFSSPDHPNSIALVGGTPISFRTLAGQGTVGASVVTTAPVGSYDPNGSGVVTALPGNNDCTIHRLYYLFGSFIWVYGQRVYASLSAALNFLEVDRSKYVPSLKLSDATLIAEIITNKNNTDLSDESKTAIITYGGAYFSIGNSGGIGEAPVDGNTYGRRNATWSATVAANAPLMTADVQITKSSPKVIFNNNPVAAGYSGLNIKQLAFNWCNMEITHPDDKTYLRSYDPANGNLRNTTTWDLATGRWTFPEAAFVSAAGSSTDTTAGRVLKVGDFGLGATGSGWGTYDLDTLHGSGFYNVDGNTSTGLPAPGSFGFLTFIDSTATDGYQIFTHADVPNTASTWRRTKVTGTWGAWQELATTDSPVFTGNPTAPTPATSDNDTSLATTAYTVARIAQDIANKAPLASPALTGTPTAPTAAAGTNTTQLATTAFSKAAVDAAAIGVGQTWQDVGASRTVNVTYTNSTGRPIMVLAGSGNTISSSKQWVINGLPGITFNNSGSVTGTTGAISAIIPAGSTYQMYSSNGNHGGWWELR